MKRWFVTVVWSLMLALPLQGLAVAVGATASTVSFGGMHLNTAALHDGMATPCHAIDTQASADEASTHAGCSQCAVCHASAAPVPPSAVTPCDSPQAQAPPAWQAPILSAVDPDSLDRPPRRTLF